MINNLDDVLRLLQINAEEEEEDDGIGIPLIPESFSAEHAAALRTQLPGIPADYLEIAQRLPLFGSSIGYFELWPHGMDKSLYDALVNQNSPGQDSFVDINSINAYYVVDHDGELICIHKDGHPNAGTIIRLTWQDDAFVATNLAPSFENLLILAANLAAHMGIVEGESVSLLDFTDMAKDLAGSPEAVAAWQHMAVTRDDRRSLLFRLHEEGMALLAEEKYRAALEKFNAAIEADDYYNNLVHAGLCHEKLGNIKQAIFYYAAGTTLSSKFVAPRRLMELFKKQGNIHAAADIAKTCLSRDPKHRYSLNILNEYEKQRAELED